MNSNAPHDILLVASDTRVIIDQRGTSHGAYVEHALLADSYIEEDPCRAALHRPAQLLRLTFARHYKAPSSSTKGQLYSSTPKKFNSQQPALAQ